MSNQDKTTFAVQEPAGQVVDPIFVQMPAKAANEEHKKKQVAAGLNRDSYSAAS